MNRDAVTIWVNVDNSPNARNQSIIWHSHATRAYIEKALYPISDIFVQPCSLLPCWQKYGWEQSNCPSAKEWIIKECHIYTIEYYSSVKMWDSQGN